MRNQARWLAKWLIGMAMSAIPGRVLARDPISQSTSPNVTAIAEALFEEGKRLYDSKQYSESCPKFAESQRLDPAPGTLLNLANCYEKLGLTSSAWATWLAAADAARAAAQREREQFARGRAAALESRLAKLRVRVATGAATTNLEVKRDGQILGEATWGVPIPIDPGEHVIEASAAGYVTFRNTYVIQDEAGTVDVTVPALTPEPSAGTASAAAPGPSAVAPQPPPQNTAASPLPNSGVSREPSRTDSTRSPHRTAAYIAGGVGVAGVLASTAFGAAAYVKNQSSMAACGDASACDTRYQQREDALKYARFANISFGIGMVGLATSLVLFAIAPERHHAVARATSNLPRFNVTPSGVSVALERAF
jgi:tetratricopeptide (TPR) repeat protein